MPSVTQIVGTAHQPRKGYLPLSKFDMIQYEDSRVVSGNYNVHPSLVGLAVDYGTRLMQGTAPREVFSVALAGASLVGRQTKPRNLSPISVRTSALGLAFLHRGSLTSASCRDSIPLSGRGSGPISQCPRSNPTIRPYLTYKRS